MASERPGDRLKRLAEEIPGVASGPSRVGNPKHHAWFVGKREFAHLHSDHVVDLRIPGEIQRELRGHPRAIFRKRASAWVELRMESAADAEEALAWLRRAADAPGP